MSNKERLSTFEICEEKEEVKAEIIEDGMLSLSISIVTVKEIINEVNMRNRIIAIIIFSVHAILLGLISVTWKMAYFYNPKLNGMDYMLIRSFSMLGFSSFSVFWYKVNVLDLKKNYRFLFSIVLISGWIYMPIYFIALKYIATVKATIAFNLYPLFASIFGVIILKEAITSFEMVWVVGAFLGVFVMMINKQSSSIDASYTIQMLSLGMVILSCILSSLSSIFIRSFNKVHNYLIFPFYSSIIIIIFWLSLVVIYPSTYNFEEYSWYDFSLFLLSGIMNVSKNTMASYALKLEEVSVLAPFFYVCPVVVFFFDILLFEYAFGITDIVGIIIVIFFLLAKLKITNKP